MGHTHKDVDADGLAIDCVYYYEGGTTNEPLLWSELPDDWQCPKCGRTKDTFKEEAELIKYRNEGGPYCDQFATNPRVDGDGNYISPGTDAYAVAYYTQNGEWQDIDKKPVYGTAMFNDGIATIDGTRVYWSGEPLDGNTGASRPNLSLVNYNNQTLALIAYEETKGVGAGSDKQAAAMEQKAPYPLVKMDDGTWEAGATNSDCRSCHYQNVVPRDRLIPKNNQTDCEAAAGTWVAGLEAYYPYTGYPFITEEPVSELPADVSIYKPGTETVNAVPCVKYFGGKEMVARDLPKPADGYNDLPDHMPGWHQAALDCTSCHLPYNTKDLDKDTVVDRDDLCLGTPEGEVVVLDSTSSDYGCSETQDPESKDNNKDEPDRYRHGKNIYYHHFPFAEPVAIAHGDQINLENKFGWSEQGDVYENARRVRVVPNAAGYSALTEESVFLGLLYKEGKDGQGAPADAILRLFHGGFDVENMDPVPLNMSSSTPVWFQDPADAGNEDGTGDNSSGDGSGDLIGGNHNTPHIEYFYWKNDNLYDPSGFWLEDDNGEKTWKSDDYTPIIRANPFENVFSTRLAIFGDTLVTGFAHCANWSAGKNAKDHYDFYIRVSKDKGTTWTLPVNVSQLKNHEESVSDCRVILTPKDIYPDYPAVPGTRDEMAIAKDIDGPGDINNENVLFVAVGTKENIPQPNPSEDEIDENEVFLDLFYSKVTLTGTKGGDDGDLTLWFETYSKENPKHETDCADNNCLEFLDAYFGFETALAEHCDDDVCIPNEPNPAYPEFIQEFDWMAKGDANQGDVQLCSNPFGSRIFTIWEQELPMVDEDGMNHFQGADVWFRKISYPDPEAASDGDVDGDGDTDWDDGTLIQQSIGTTAYDADFLWTADYVPDLRITGQDYSRWKVQYTEDMLKKQRKQWKSK
nr:choice-of-anchor O protein [Desulfopila sp. IMCC35006]